MSKAKIVFIALAGLIVGAGNMAQAKDVCIAGFPNSDYIIVCKNFAVPKKNTCKPCVGFNEEGALISEPLGLAVSGTGCLNAAGSEFFFTVTDGSAFSEFTETDNVAWNGSSGFVYGTGIFDDSGPNTFDFTGSDIAVFFCTGAVAEHPSQQKPQPGFVKVPGGSQTKPAASDLLR